MTLHLLINAFASILQRNPATGYAVGAVPTALGILNLMEHINAILGSVSLIVGISLGIVTLLIQLGYICPRRRKRDD